MKSFTEIAEILTRYADNKSFLGVENFSENLNYKSYLYNYNNIDINTMYNLERNIVEFLSYYNDKRKKDCLKNDILFKDIIFKFEDIKYKINLQEAEKKTISDLKSNINELKDAINGLEKIKERNENRIKSDEDYYETKYHDKRIMSLTKQIKELGVNLRKKNKDYKSNNEDINNFISDLKIIKDIYIDFDNSIKETKTEANSFINGINKNKILNFLNKKSEYTKWEFTKSQFYEEVLFFKDDSIVVKEKNEYKSIQPNGDNYNVVSRKIMKDFVSFTYKKKPNYISKVYELLELDNFNIINMKNMTETFFNNEQILKNSKFNYLEELKISIENKTSLEKLDDKMNKIISEFKVNNLAFSILSNKYKHLYNNKTNELFKEVYDLKVDKNLLQDSIGKKLASFKKPAELNKSLQLFINTINQFDLESIKLKAISLNCNICIENEKSIVLKINDFEASKILGSQSWCLSRNKSYFDSYTNNNNAQYFYFDFEKNSKDNKSMIGFTIEKNGNLNTAHMKNDDYINFNDNYKNIYFQVLQKDIKNFDLNDKLKKEINELNNKKVIKNENKI